MTGERFQRGTSSVGTTDGERDDDGRIDGCLTEAGIQGLADGSLRGPERMMADEHLMTCPRCSAELAIYEGLVERLNLLADPPLPAGFTEGVLAAVQVHEQVRDDKHKAVLASLPAALLSIGILFFWAFGQGSSASRIRDLIVGATLFRRVAEASLSVLQAVRVPLALSALVFLVAVLALLSRALSSLRGRAAA